MNEEEVLTYLKRSMIKEGRAQSMSEEFAEGFNHALYLIDRFAESIGIKELPDWRKVVDPNRLLK